MHLSSEEIRSLIQSVIGHEVKETSLDNGYMAYSIPSRYDEFSVVVRIKDFLSAYYGCSEDEIKLFWNPYDWTYSAEILLNA